MTSFIKKPKYKFRPKSAERQTSSPYFNSKELANIYGFPQIK